MILSFEALCSYRKTAPPNSNWSLQRNKQAWKQVWNALNKLIQIEQEDFLNGLEAAWMSILRRTRLRGSACTLHSEAAMVHPWSLSSSKHLEATAGHDECSPWTRWMGASVQTDSFTPQILIHSYPIERLLGIFHLSSFIIIYHHLSSFIIIYHIVITWCTCFHLYLFWFQSLSKELEKSLRSLRYFKLVHPTTHQWIQSLRPLQQGWHYDIGHRVCVTGLGQKANKRQLQASNMEYIWVHEHLGYLVALQLWQ